MVIQNADKTHTETVAKQNYPLYVNEGDWDYYLLLKGNAKKQ
jgi:hypothetical protein